MIDTISKIGSDAPPQNFCLLVANATVEMAGVVTVKALSEDDAREKFEGCRSVDQHLLSVIPESSVTSARFRTR